MRISGNCRASVGASLALALVAAMCGAAAPADAQSAALGAGANGGSPFAVQIFTHNIEVGAAGGYTDTIHLRLRANNDAAAQKLGQQPVGFVASTSDAEILDAYTLKADGRKLPVDASSIYTQPVPNSPQMPMFDDQRQKVVVFPQVEAGDSVDLSYKYTEKEPILPGSFTFVMPFSRFVPHEDAEISIVAPRSLPLNIETHELDFEKRSEGDKVSYLWHYKAPVASPVETSLLSPLDTSPRLYASSFKDYDAFARLYAGLIASKEQVTPRIQAKADEITAGISDRRLQAQKLYEWVSAHIRYVAVEIGVGAIVPHDADTVLANGYGDCKDHVALFAALLKAKGIEGDFVLINLGNSYFLPQTAVIGQLNHAITWLPEFQLYADTTAHVAPFGTLPFGEYGKPVVRIGTSGPARVETPLLAPGQASMSIATTGQIDDKGGISAHTTLTADGAYSVLLRALATEIQAAGPDRAFAALMTGQGTSGSGSFEISPPETLGPSYALSGRYELAADPDRLKGKRFGVPGTLSVLSVPGDLLMGPLFNRQVTDSDPTPCYAGHQVEDVTLDAPAGYAFDDPPDDSKVETAHIKYATHWSVSGSRLTLHREFTATPDAALCSGALRKEAAKALADIRNSYDYGIAIEQSADAPRVDETVGGNAVPRGPDDATKGHDNAPDAGN